MRSYDDCEHSLINSVLQASLRVAWAPVNSLKFLVDWSAAYSPWVFIPFLTAIAVVTRNVLWVVVPVALLLGALVLPKLRGVIIPTLEPIATILLKILRTGFVKFVAEPIGASLALTGFVLTVTGELPLSVINFSAFVIAPYHLPRIILRAIGRVRSNPFGYAVWFEAMTFVAGWPSLYHRLDVSSGKIQGPFRPAEARANVFGRPIGTAGRVWPRCVRGWVVEFTIKPPQAIPWDEIDLKKELLASVAGWWPVEFDLEYIGHEPEGTLTVVFKPPRVLSMDDILPGLVKWARQIGIGLKRANVFATSDSDELINDPATYRFLPQEDLDGWWDVRSELAPVIRTVVPTALSSWQSDFIPTRDGFVLGRDIFNRTIFADIGHRHYLASGPTGSGKTNILDVVMQQGLFDPNIAFFGIDPNDQLLSYRERFALLEGEKNGCGIVISDVHNLFERRQALVREALVSDDDGVYDIKNRWNPQRFGPYVFLVIDEFSTVLAWLKQNVEAQQQFEDLLKMGRKRGICVVANAQRVIKESSDITMVRENFAVATVHEPYDPHTAVIGLGLEDTTSEHADLRNWRDITWAGGNGVRTLPRSRREIKFFRVPKAYDEVESRYLTRVAMGAGLGWSLTELGIDIGEEVAA